MVNNAVKAQIYSDCSSAVIVRSSMKVDSEKILRIQTGTIVKAKQVNNEWSIVQFENKEGYVMNRFLIFL